MDLIDTDTEGSFFNVIAGTDRSQAAMLVLEAGQSTGGPTNQHPKADQWVYVKAGTGEAIVEEDRYPLDRGDLLLIEAGECHEIIAGEQAALETVTIYAPPEY